MECRNCSGNDFKRIETGNYKCSYCGTLYFEEKRHIPRVYVLKFKKPLIITIVIAFLGAIMIPLILNLQEIKSDKAGIVSIENKSENNTKYINENEHLKPEGKIVSIDTIPDSIGNIYFLAIVENTGDTVLRKPMVTVRLFSKKNKKLHTGRGYAFKNKLNPREKTPVYVLIKDYSNYEYFKSEFKPELPFVVSSKNIVEDKFLAKFSQVKFLKGAIGNSRRINGRIKNTGSRTGEYVHVGAVLYDNKNHAVGYGTAYTGELILNPGESDNFKIYITTVKGHPQYYKLYYDALLK